MKSELFPGLPSRVSAAHPRPLCCSSQTLLALRPAPLSQAQTLGHAVSKRPRLQQGLSPRSPHNPMPTCTTREITTVSPAAASLSPHAHPPVGPGPCPSAPAPLFTPYPVGSRPSPGQEHEAPQPQQALLPHQEVKPQLWPHCVEAGVCTRAFHSQDRCSSTKNQPTAC